MFQAMKQGTTRRRWLLLTPVALAGVAAIWPRKQAGLLNSHFDEGSTPGDTDGEVTVVQFNDAGERTGAARVAKVVRSDQEWWKMLSPQQYYVARRQQTDPPFSGTYYRMHDRGLFRCICCGNAVFSSTAKYESGTGWPSFREPVAKENIRWSNEPNVALASGVEVLCRLCDAHLGHVFDDGPAPAHLRYCINESSLRFARG